jgi:uncharacterized protein YxeA
MKKIILLILGILIIIAVFYYLPATPEMKNQAYPLWERKQCRQFIDDFNKSHSLKLAYDSTCNL